MEFAPELKAMENTRGRFDYIGVNETENLTIQIYNKERKWRESIESKSIADQRVMNNATKLFLFFFYSNLRLQYNCFSIKYELSNLFPFLTPSADLY